MGELVHELPRLPERPGVLGLLEQTDRFMSHLKGELAVPLQSSEPCEIE